VLYRAWAAFGDPRLPERYDGAGTAPEDQSLFDDIAAVLPTLPADQRPALEAYLLRPTDPKSAWSAPATGAAAGTVATVAAGMPPTDTCVAPRTWYSHDWSAANGSDVNLGFRFWACEGSQAAADGGPFRAIEPIAAKAWELETTPEPNGLGLPAPDTYDKPNDGNGKVDVYLLDSIATCRPRGDECKELEGHAGLAIGASGRTCGAIGAGGMAFPSTGCSSYMLLPKEEIGKNGFPGTFVHEFFHVLQNSHNAFTRDSWYVEASATWAEWQYDALTGAFGAAEQQYERNRLLLKAREYIAAGHSLLRHRYDSADGYLAWVWPLFQATEGGAKTVFTTWQALEGASTLAEIDAAHGARFPFDQHFRDFAVWNAQPTLYRLGVSTGLDDVRWQTKPDLGPPDEFTDDPRPQDYSNLRLGLGQTLLNVNVEPADASYSLFDEVDDAVRQIEIDATGLSNVNDVQLDVLGRLAPAGEDATDDWRRIKGTSAKMVLCRDKPTEDVELFELIVSNKASNRQSVEQPNSSDRAEGVVTITAKDSCELPKGFTGSFSGTGNGQHWSGTATYKRVQPNTPGGECELNTAQTVYCYELVSGSVQWVTPEAGAGTFSLVPPDATGMIVLIVNDARTPAHNGTYELDATPATTIKLGSRSAYSFEGVQAWINAIQYPSVPGDYHLAGSENSGDGTCGYEGCGPIKQWMWDFTPTY
jgi:hypothetical protein